MEPAIVLMSKVPKEGKTKTRLMDRLGPFECVAFHQACLLDICNAINETGIPGYLYYKDDKGDTPHDKGVSLDGFGVEELNEIIPVPQRLVIKAYSSLVKRKQEGQDLGERMYNVAVEVLADHDKVLIIGADSPQLRPYLLIDAIKMLEFHEVVIGPAIDGGYYLIGFKKLDPYFFDHIPWGTSEVLKITVERLKHQNITCGFLPEDSDIDVWADLVKFYRNDKKYNKKLLAYYFAKKMIIKYGMD